MSSSWVNVGVGIEQIASADPTVPAQPLKSSIRIVRCLNGIDGLLGLDVILEFLNAIFGALGTFAPQKDPEDDRGPCRDCEQEPLDAGEEPRDHFWTCLA